MITAIIINSLLINRRFRCICYLEAAAFRMDYAQQPMFFCEFHYITTRIGAPARAPCFCGTSGDGVFRVIFVKNV